MTAKLEDLLKPSQFLAKKLLIMIVKLTNSQSDLYTQLQCAKTISHRTFLVLLAKNSG